MKTIIIVCMFILFSFNLSSQNNDIFNNSFGESGDCQNNNNANCSKWWSSLDNLKRATFAWGYADRNGAFSDDWVFCTGTLINQNIYENKNN